MDDLSLNVLLCSYVHFKVHRMGNLGGCDRDWDLPSSLSILRLMLFDDAHE